MAKIPGAVAPVRSGTQGNRDTDPLFDAWREAGRLAGWPVTDDPNGADPIGFGDSQWTIHDGRRASASAAYLKPILQRRNLTVRTDARATRVTLRGTRATGVEFVHRGATVHAEATREVILCGGVFNSPQLLMLSGIGPAEHLREMGIAPLIDLPVGRNLRDHLQVRLRWSRLGPGRSPVDARRSRRPRDGSGLAVPNRPGDHRCRMG